jgi:hypothetical protein
MPGPTEDQSCIRLDFTVDAADLEVLAALAIKADAESAAHAQICLCLQ